MRNLEIKCGTNKHFQLKKRSLTFKKIYIYIYDQAEEEEEEEETAVNRTRIYAYDGDDLIVKTQ
jgi:hypothetical protein